MANAYIRQAIKILGQADRNDMTVPERRMYDAAMESYRYLPQAELLHDIEEAAKQINFRYLRDTCGGDYVDFSVCMGQADERARAALEMWKSTGWYAELIEKPAWSSVKGKKMMQSVIRVKRGMENEEKAKSAGSGQGVCRKHQG